MVKHNKNIRIMKAKYLKPTVEFEPMMDELLLQASILEKGGSTSEGGVTSGDARGGRFSTWEDDVEE
jgi:hypothetical protein